MSLLDLRETKLNLGVELRRLRYTGSAKIYDDPAPKFDMKVPIEHVTGSFTGKLSMSHSKVHGY
jgi:hypothetical protein